MATGAGSPAGLPPGSDRDAARARHLFLGTVGGSLVLFGDTVVRFFTPDPAVVAEGGRCLRIVAGGFAFYAYGMVVTQAFNGAGDTRTPTRIDLDCFWLGSSRWPWSSPARFTSARRGPICPSRRRSGRWPSSR